MNLGLALACGPYSLRCSGRCTNWSCSHSLVDEIAVGMSYRRFESVIFASSPCVESPNGYVATGSMLEAPPLTRTRRMLGFVDRTNLCAPWIDDCVGCSP